MDRKDLVTLVGSLAIAGLVALGARSFRFGKAPPAPSSSAGTTAAADAGPGWICTSQCTATRVTPDLAAKLASMPRESRILVLDRPTSEDVATLKLAPPLQILVIEAPVGSIDLSAIAEVGDIATLNLQRVTAESLAPLASMSTRVLLVSHLQGADSLAPVGQMKQLEELRMYGPLPAPLSSLGGSSLIRTLEIAESNVARLDGIEELAQLSQLELQTTRGVDLTILPKLSHVTYLRMTDVGVEALPALPPHLTKLAIGVGHLEKPVFVERPAELTSLNLDQLGVTDVSGLAQVTTLTELILAHNRNLKDLTPLGSLTKLKTLSLFNTGVESLEPLQRLPLETLTLTNAPVKSIEPLKKISTLRYVHGLMVNITDGDIAALEKANPNVKVSRR